MTEALRRGLGFVAAADEKGVLLSVDEGYCGMLSCADAETALRLLQGQDFPLLAIHQAGQERAQIDDDNVRIAAADLPRELGRRLARRAIGTVRQVATIENPAWSEGGNIEKLLDALAAGSRATQAGVIASVRSGVWRFRPAPPRRTG